MTRHTDTDRPRPATDQPPRTEQPAQTDRPAQTTEPAQQTDRPARTDSTAGERATEADSRPESTPSRMGEISHRNPFTGKTAGHLLLRGPTVRTDGGEDEHVVTDATEADPEQADPEQTDSDSGDESDEPTRADEDRPQMRDVDHTPPKDAADANRVFERGGRESIVESEE